MQPVDFASIPVHNNLWGAPWNCGDSSVIPRDPVCNFYDPQFYGGFQTSASDKVYGLAGWGGNKTFMRLYPTVAAVATPVVTPTQFAVSGEGLVVTGLNAGGALVTYIHDGTTGVDTSLFAPDSFEVFTLTTSPTERKVYFSGSRFSDNSTVNGYIDMVTKQPVITTTVGAKLDSVALFR